MVLQVRQCLRGPALQIGVVAALGAAFEQADRVFVRANLIVGIFLGEVVRLVKPPVKPLGLPG